MRKKSTAGGLTLQAISGTYVVLLGMDLPKARCTGLLGFAIHRTDQEADEAYWMEGLKTFEETDPGLPAGTKYSTRQHPIQGFTWSDFTAKPGRKYTYRVIALKGSPDALAEYADVSVEIETESPEGGDHDVYFNRGAAASQEYARRFGNERPEEVGQAAYDWLSRGLFEAMIAFIEQAKGPSFELRVCAYEFRYEPVLEALKAAKNRGATVRIIYDRRKDNPGEANDAAVTKVGIKSLCIRRMAYKSAISHNKFIVLLHNGAADCVWTGGTNLSEGGIFGHSNAAHVVEDPAVADAFSRYWDLLSADPERADLAPAISQATAIPQGLPPKGTTVVFSPRADLDALNFYARLALNAKDGLFMTFAFGMHGLFQDAYRNGSAKMRYALFEKATRPMKPGPARDAEEKAIFDLRKLSENRFAIGTQLRLNLFDRWLAERTSGLNNNVQYVHTKFMLVDPLGPDPIVIAGSANFSAASSDKNDENMVIVRGNSRVAEIYLGEFMRMYNHYAFREWAASQQTNSPQMRFLRTDAWWTDYFGDTERSHQRQFFAS